MTTEDKIRLIDEFAHSVSTIKGYADFDQDLMDFRPFAEAWTIREHIVHLAESEICSFHRYRKAIAEPGGQVIGYDEEAFTNSKELDYGNESAKDWLECLMLLRKLSANHLRRIASADWSKYFYTHNENGPVSLQKYVEIYINHIKTHKDYMDRNIGLHKKA